MSKIVLLGCGGHAKSVIDAIEGQNKYQIAGFVTNDGLGDPNYRGYKIIGDDDSLPKIFDSGIKNAFICVGFMGKSKARNILYQKLTEIGFELPVIADKTAIIASDAIIGDGSFIGKRAVINSNAKIGKMTIINTGAIVEHDCTVGDFSHISVGTVLCGSVSVNMSCFIGASSVVIQGKTIDSDVIVGAGSTVIRDICPGETVKGLVK